VRPLDQALEHPADRIDDRRGRFDSVAVLKNAELRTERTLQTKLDAIAGSLLEDRRGHPGDAEEQLERSIQIQEQI
jgi:hypothetical protein